MNFTQDILSLFARIINREKREEGGGEKENYESETRLPRTYDVRIKCEEQWRNISPKSSGGKSNEK